MTNGDVTWIANYIWGIVDDVLRDLHVRGKYRDVILPMTVLRRLDAVLEGTKQAVPDMKATHGRLDGRRPGELDAGGSSHRRDLPQTGRPAPGAHNALRPRRADDQQVTPRSASSCALSRAGCRRTLGGGTTPASPGASTTSPPRSPSAERSSFGTTPSFAMAGSRCSPRTNVHHHRSQSVLDQRGRTLDGIRVAAREGRPTVRSWARFRPLPRK